MVNIVLIFLAFSIQSLAADSITVADKDHVYSIVQQSFRPTDSNLIETPLKIGKRFHIGIGTAPDLSLAIKCYLKAARDGNYKGYLLAGTLFELGDSETDCQKAEACYELAASKGIKGAFTALGKFYEKELLKSFPRRDNESLEEWYKSIARIYNFADEDHRLKVEKMIASYRSAAKDTKDPFAEKRYKIINKYFFGEPRPNEPAIGKKVCIIFNFI